MGWSRPRLRPGAGHHRRAGGPLRPWLRRRRHPRRAPRDALPRRPRLRRELFRLRSFVRRISSASASACSRRRVRPPAASVRAPPLAPYRALRCSWRRAANRQRSPSSGASAERLPPRGVMRISGSVVTCCRAGVASWQRVVVVSGHGLHAAASSPRRSPRPRHATAAWCGCRLPQGEEPANGLGGPSQLDQPSLARQTSPGAGRGCKGAGPVEAHGGPSRRGQLSRDGRMMVGIPPAFAGACGASSSLRAFSAAVACFMYAVGQSRAASGGFGQSGWLIRFQREVVAMTAWACRLVGRAPEAQVNRGRMGARSRAAAVTAGFVPSSVEQLGVGERLARWIEASRPQGGAARRAGRRTRAYAVIASVNA